MPEYSIGRDSKNRSVIVTTPINGDNDASFKKAALIGDVTNSYFKSGLNTKAVNKLQEILPPDISELFAQAVLDGQRSAKISFQINKDGQVQVNEVQIPFNNK